MMQRVNRRGRAAYPEKKFLDCMHGGISHRRREAAIRVQLIASWRLMQLGVSHATVFYDQANAFGSISQQAVDDVDYQHYDIDD
eukprot:6346296-Pyramimonas_sp.AAC.1